MWLQDEGGIELSGPQDAYIALRQRALRLIEDGDAISRDVRQQKIRLRDDHDNILFEGTLEEAARLQIDGQIYLPTAP